jgi:hypothetical protein
MSVKLSSDIRTCGSLFQVKTVTRFLFMSKPPSAVIPLILNNRHTLDRGFLVQYTTADPELLHQWHELLCRKVQDGMFDLMLEQAREGIFPLDEDEMPLGSYVAGFRCP